MLKTTWGILANFAKLIAAAMLLLAVTFIPVQSRSSSDQIRGASTFTSTLDANTFTLHGGCRTQLIPVKAQGREVLVQFHSTDPVDFFIMSEDQWLHAPSRCLQLSIDPNTILTVTGISGSYNYHFYPPSVDVYWLIFLNRNARDVSISYTFLVGAVRVTVSNETATSSPSFRVFSTEGFYDNQSAVIAIGQWAVPSYGILNPQGGLAFDPLGNLWVADTYNSRVLGFMAPFSNNMSAFVVLGQPDFVGNRSAIGPNRLNYPIGVAFDREGNLWVADMWNSRLLEFEPPFHNGMNASVVIGQFDFSNRSFTTSRNGLSGPWGITFDASGNLWVVDSGNGRVLEFQPPFETGMNASLVVGEPDFVSYCNSYMRGDCGTRTVLNGPIVLAFDLSGNLWVAETQSTSKGGRLLEFKPPFKNGMEASLVIEPVYPSSLTFDSAGDLWMGGFGLGVFEFNPPFSDNMNASLALAGYTRAVSSYDYVSETIAAPYGLSFDSAGNLWVSDFRGSMLIGGVFGRVLGFDAHVHSVTTAMGRVVFKNNDGLLVPLTSIPVSRVPTAPELPAATFPYGLFNFTIQCLNSGGSVSLTIAFPQPLPANLEWWSLRRGEWTRLPSTQFSVNGSNLTLTLTGASSNGVISILGGPTLPSNTTNSQTTFQITSQTTMQPTSPLGGMLYVWLAGVVVTGIVILAYRNRPRKTRGAPSNL